MTITDILNEKGRSVTSVPCDSRLRAAIALMHSAGIGSVVVLDETGKRPIGLVSQTQILAAFARLGAAALDARVTSVMDKPVFCQLQMTDEEVLAKMTSTKNRHVVVLDERERMQGLVSIGDLIASRMNDLTTERMVLRDLARSRLLAA